MKIKPKDLTIEKIRELNLLGQKLAKVVRKQGNKIEHIKAEDLYIIIR